MPRPGSLDDIFNEPDDLDLLSTDVRTSAATSIRNPDVEAVTRVNEFFDETGRTPDPDSDDFDEMRLGAIWEKVRRSPTEEMLAADRNQLLSTPHAHSNSQDRSTRAASWRDDPTEEDIPSSFDDLLLDEDEEIHDALLSIKNVTPAAERNEPDHRGELRPCKGFSAFEEGFADMQNLLDTSERVADVIKPKQTINLNEGDYFIHRGLLAYVAEKAEYTRRSRKGGDHRIRVIYSNGMETDPLLSSFRKALTEDRTARLIHRPGIGNLDPNWDQDKMMVTGTVYVVRSLSEDPQISEVSHILHKIGVTSQDVKRRVADARNDPTFLLAPVEIVATYELKNLDRTKVEHLLHDFFHEARLTNLSIPDRFGKRFHPREWFYILPEHVSAAVELLRTGRIGDYRYDGASQRIIEKHQKLS